jgi:hypothetical protein
MNPTIVQVYAQSKCMAFPCLQKDFHHQKNHNINQGQLGFEAPPRWQHIDDLKSTNSPNHPHHNPFGADRLTHPRWDLISHHPSFC